MFCDPSSLQHRVFKLSYKVYRSGKLVLSSSRRKEVAVVVVALAAAALHLVRTERDSNSK